MVAKVMVVIVLTAATKIVVVVIIMVLMMGVIVPIVRKGGRGNRVAYANTITKTEEGAVGAEEERTIPFVKAYSAFSVDQIDGLPER